MRKHSHITLLGAVILLVGAAASAPHASEPLSLDDLVRLVEGGVGTSIVQHKVRRSGLGFDFDVEAILALRSAGADDSLIRFLIDARNQEQETEASPRTGVRLIHRRSPSGQETVVLTNLSRDGRRLQDDDATPVRGIISSSTRAEPEDAAGVARGTDAPTGRSRVVSPGAVGMVPSTIEVTVRREDDNRTEQIDELEGRLAALEGRSGRPPVGADLPRHPINDHRDYPIVAYPYGFPVLVPFAFEPQEFQVHASGPFASFTSAFRVGFNPFAAPPPCQPGVACSVTQRLAHR